MSIWFTLFAIDNRYLFRLILSCMAFVVGVVKVTKSLHINNIQSIISRTKFCSNSLPFKSYISTRHWFGLTFCMRKIWPFFDIHNQKEFKIYNYFIKDLTKWTLDQHRFLHLQRFAHAILILCINPEHILSPILQPSHVVPGAVYGTRHVAPAVTIGFAFLQNVVGDLAASVVNGRTPGEGDGILGDAFGFQRFLRWSGFVCGIANGKMSRLVYYVSISFCWWNYLIYYSDKRQYLPVLSGGNFMKMK